MELPVSLFTTDSYEITDAVRKCHILRHVFDRYHYTQPQLPIQQCIDICAIQDQYTPEEKAFVTATAFTHYSQINKETLEQLFEDVIKQLDQLPTLIIYSPVHLNKDHRIKIGKQVKAILGPNSMIEWKLNPDLIAGCAFSWNDTYREFTVINRLHSARTIIAERFSSYDQKKSA